MPQQRQWQNIQRQQQRAYAQPQQNWGQFRRQQAFAAKRDRDQFKRQERSERDAWKFARKQQRFDDKAYRNSERATRRYDRSYADQQRNAWVNNYPYQQRYRDNRTYGPSYPDYRSYRQTYPQQYYQGQGFYEPQYRQNDYSQVYTPYGGNVYDDYNGYSNGGSNWAQPLIRSVIAAFFSNGVSNSYSDDYDQPYYAGDNYGYASQHQYSQPRYHTFGYAPTSAYYEPAAYYGHDQYTYNDLPYDRFAGALPYNDVQDIYSGGIAGELIQRELGTGYYQGLLEGQQARKRGWGDRYYSDPYVYEQAIYDPYSTSIGDSRRHFSEGYEMGYEDALSGRDDFDLAGGGEVDLVSLLLGNVLSFRG